MAKGKKTVIKEIKRVSEDTLLINGSEYVIIEDTKDIETATTMKVTSHGNRILRFDNLEKKATIDLKRDINILRVTIFDKDRAAKFKKSFDRNSLIKQDKIEIIDNTSSHVKARKIVDSYKKKNGENYDKLSGINNFYLTEEIK